MAVQVDSPGQLQEFLGILKQRKWQVLLPVVYLVVLGSSFAVIVPKKYKCTTQVELRQLYLEGARGDRALSISTLEAGNAAHQLRSLARIRKVVEKLEWTDYLRLEPGAQNEFLQRVLSNLQVSVPRREADAGSTFVTITYYDVNPQRAYEFLRDLRTTWIREVVERDRDQIRDEYNNLFERWDEEDKLWQTLERQLAELRATHDLSPTQPGSGANQSRREDPHFERLTRNQELLEDLELALRTAEARIEGLLTELADTPPTIPLVELVGGTTFEQKMADLRVTRAALVRDLELSGYRPPHSGYRNALKDIERIDRTIADLEDEVVEAEERTSFEPNPQYTDIENLLVTARLEARAARERRDALRQVVERDQELSRDRQEVYRQERELQQRIEESTQRLVELGSKLTSKRVQMDFVRGDSGNPFTITQEPVPPNTPSEPNPWLIIAFALIAGLGLGVGSAVVREFSKSSFRSPADLGRVMTVPVLGVIETIVTRPQVRRRRVQRIAVAISSVVLIGSVVFVTWAWASRPDLLAPGLKDGIEDFRQLFL